MSEDGEKTCPLCAEEMDLTDQQLKPCKCGYEMCVWCWHRILDMAEKDDMGGRCPACRSPYDKEKIVGMAMNCQRLVSEINMERKKSQKSRIKSSDGRKHLSSVRVIQKNLVYIVGLPLELADEDLLQRREYFGQYGRVLKVSISRTAAGVIQQFLNNTCSVYITYSKEEEAVRCIQYVHGFFLCGRSLRACFGTTKYCHAWLRNMTCTNPDCLYLHEVGSQEDSFTKDEIISAYTRSKVQQFAGASSNVTRSGSVLPPPVDVHSCCSSSSATKTLAVNVSDSLSSLSRISLPGGSSYRSAAHPPAPLWGARNATQSQEADLTYVDVDAKLKLATDSATSSTTQLPRWHLGDSPNLKTGKMVANSRSDSHQHTFAETTNSTDINSQADPISFSSSISLNDASNCSFPGYIDTNTFPFPNSCSLNCHPDVTTEEADRNIQRGLLETANDNLFVCNLSESTQCDRKLQRNSMKNTEPSCKREKPTFSESKSAALQEIHLDHSFETDDVLFSDNPGFKVPDICHAIGDSDSSNSVHFLSHSKPYHMALNQRSDPFKTSTDYSVIGYSDCAQMGASADSLNVIGCSDMPSNPTADLFPMDFKKGVRPAAETQECNDETSAMGEDSIISNILSLDLDAWDETLASPQNLTRLLREIPETKSPIRCWKAHGTESRFPFARQEDSGNEAFAICSFGPCKQCPNNHSLASCIHNDAHLHKPAVGVDCFDSITGLEASASSLLSPSNKSKANNCASLSSCPVTSAKGSTPDLPNKRPPPGFSSNLTAGKTCFVSENHLLGSSVMPQKTHVATSPNSSAEIDFVDPAILAIGKGSTHGWYHNANPTRSKLFQNSISAPQSLRCVEMREGFPFADSCYMSSSREDCPNASSLSHIAQTPFQTRTNEIVSKHISEIHGPRW